MPKSGYVLVPETGEWVLQEFGDNEVEKKPAGWKKCICGERLHPKAVQCRNCREWFCEEDCREWHMGQEAKGLLPVVDMLEEAGRDRRQLGEDLLASG